MTHWPFWRLLVSIEVWLLLVAALNIYRPIHPRFVVTLLIAVVPAGVMVAMWALSRGASPARPTGQERATVIELVVAAVSAIAAAGWMLVWAREAHQDLQRVEAMLGQATVIIDVSLAGLSLAACLGALALDTLLAAQHERLRHAMQWLQRAHVVVTATQVMALFGSAWLFTQLPSTGTAENPAAFERARIALHVYEYARATVFPTQAFFAAMALALTAADHYAD